MSIKQQDAYWMRAMKGRLLPHPRVGNKTPLEGHRIMPEIANDEELRQRAYAIHRMRLGTDATRDDCLQCWNMARRKLGMEPVAGPSPVKRRTASGLWLPESAEDIP